MPRKGQAPHREVGPEPVYNSVIVHRLINKLMVRGKKSLAEHVVYTAFDQIKERSGQDPVKVLDKALHNVMPVLEVRPRRVGGATYQVPIEVRPERRLSLRLRWLVGDARGRKEKRTMMGKLIAGVLEAPPGEGGGVEKREDTPRLGEGGKALAH